MSTLTKGPLGVVLAEGGLLALFWERKSGRPSPLRGSHFTGIMAFIIVVGGWFFLAYQQYGHALVNRMLLDELVGQAATDGNSTYPGMHFYRPPLYYLAQSAPWSVLAYYALWRLVKMPATDPGERQFERFLFCWFVLGLVIFSLSPNQRGDHLWPILPAGALLAGRELDRLTRLLSPPVLHRWMIVTVGVAIVGFWVFYLYPQRSKVVRQTTGIKQMAEQIEQRGGEQFPLTHVDDPMALQTWLNTLRPQVSMKSAAQLLRGPVPAFIAVKDLDALQAARQPADPPFFTLLPETQPADCPAHIVSNHPKLERTDDFAFCFGPVLAKVHHARLVRASEEELRFAPADKGTAVIVVNQSAQPRPVCVCVVVGDREVRSRHLLAAGESWKADLAGMPAHLAAR